MSLVFPAPAATRIPVNGESAFFPVHRIYCIGQNYALHAKEMGTPVDTERPVFFCKPADAVVTGDADVPYPPGTDNLHHEVELVVALSSGGHDIPVERALDCVFGYAIGLDLTRRDLQALAKKAGRPWDSAKAFDHSAPISAIHRVDAVGHPGDIPLTLEVNGETRQQTTTGEMVSDVATIIHELSKLWELAPGDLVFTGTPAGVAPLVRGDRFRAVLGDFATLEGRIV